MKASETTSDHIRNSIQFTSNNVLKIVALIVLLIFATSESYAQVQVAVPQGINYQAIARDDGGNPIVNADISLRINIVSSSLDGNVEYVEEHNVTTNEFGLFTLVIGKGAPVKGAFDDVSWSNANQWLKLELDPDGGNNYIDMGGSQLLSVPFALHAGTAGSLAGTGSTNNEGGGSRALDDWLLVGNSGTTAGSDFVGTTDDVDLVFKTNSIEMLRIESPSSASDDFNDDIGIGTGTTSAGEISGIEIGGKILHIKSSGSRNSRLIVESSSGGGNPGFYFFQGSGPVNARTAGHNVNGGIYRFSALNDAFVISHDMFVGDLSNGFVGLGTTTPKNQLDVEGGAVIGATYSGTNTAPTNGMLIQGNVSIGKTTNNKALDVAGKISTDGINETSDRRFKKNIMKLENSLDKVLQLRGVSYYWRVGEIKDHKFEEGKQLGLIAQEVEKLLPEVVDTDNDGYKSIAYTDLMPLLIEAIKEQNEIIKQQQLTIQSNAIAIEALQRSVNSIYDAQHERELTTEKE